jgi:two-component system, sensor histidine kinase and response regulator
MDDELIDEARVRGFRTEYPDIVDELVGVFADSSAALLADLAAAVARADDAEVARAAHKLKGASRNMGAGLMAQLAGELERGDGPRLELVEQLETALPLTDAAIRSTLADT